jgi:hypothetical protein
MLTEFFREVLKFFILYLVRPVALVCGALITSVYNVLFGWWLDDWLFKRRQIRFENEIEKEYSWLFEKYGARIVPATRYRQVLDYVVATVAIGGLLLQFVKGNGEFRANVAPTHAPHDWYDFGEALELACDAKSATSSTRHYRMANFRQLFEPNIDRLMLFYSKEQYGESRRDRTVKKVVRL